MYISEIDNGLLSNRLQVLIWIKELSTLRQVQKQSLRVELWTSAPLPNSYVLPVKIVGAIMT